MSKYLGSKTSRVFDFDAKSLQLLVARSGKAITDAEGILLQDLQAFKLSELTRTQTFSGCVDLPNYSVQGNSIIIPPFRALIHGELVLVQGTNNPSSPSNLDNYLDVPLAPLSGFDTVIVYLEMWYQLLDEDLVKGHGFYPNLTWDSSLPRSDRYYFPYGNTLADPSWIQTSRFADDLANSNNVGPTSGRVQVQYALRAKSLKASSEPITEYIQDFGLTHPNLAGMTFDYASPQVPPTSFIFMGASDPGLYRSSLNSVPSVDGYSYAIPLAVVYKRNQGVWNPLSNAHGCKKNNTLSSSGRPDGKDFDTVYLDDIIDTRSSFLGGSLEDYKSTIAQTVSRLWQGSLRLKIAEPLSSEPNAHQTGQTLLSQEFLGDPFKTSSYGVSSPIPQISANSLPHTSWTSDAIAETLSYKITPDMRDGSFGLTTTSANWVSGDTVTLTYGPASFTIDSVSLYTYNTQAQILRIPPAYIAVSGIGSNTITLTWSDLGADLRYDLGKPIWAVLSIKRPANGDHFRFVPQKVHTPLFVQDPSVRSTPVPQGVVSDLDIESNDFLGLDPSVSLRSYKRNYSPNIFGTTLKVRVGVNNFEKKSALSQSSSSSTSSSVSFESSSISKAQTVQLSWSVDHAQRVTLTNTSTSVSLGDVPTQGTLDVRVTEPTEFTLTAWNQGVPTIATRTVLPPTDLIGPGVTTSLVATRTYAFPGAGLNPENIYADYSVVNPLSFTRGLVEADPLVSICLGCIKATWVRDNLSTGQEERIDLQIRHQHFSDASSNDTLSASEIGVLGWFPSDSSEIEFEFLLTGIKTFCHNPSVQGITSVSETFAVSQKNYLYFSSKNSYNLITYLDYAQSSLKILLTAPSNTWGSYEVGGIFEGVFGFNSQAFVFVKVTGNDYYQTVPCSVQGLGSPIICLTVPSISLSQIDDVLVLAHATTTLKPGSNTLFTYDYVPYQGEGDPLDSYHLTYLNELASVTTSGTGFRVTPGLSSIATLNTSLPISTVLPSCSDWNDASLRGSKFTLSGQFSGLGSPAKSSTDFIETPHHATVSGHIKNLLALGSSGTATLSPRKECKRGFTNNILAFSYVIDTPKIVSSASQLTSSDLVYYVNTETGDDANSGLTRNVAAKSLQAILNRLPEVITSKITININGDTKLPAEDISSVNIVKETPYGHPERDAIYALVHTSFRTDGEGQVIVQRDPIAKRVSFEVPDPALFSRASVYGWLHSKGNLLIKDIDFYAWSGVIFAAYPGSIFRTSNVSFDGGEIQLLCYGSQGFIETSSFTNPQVHHVILSSNAFVTFGSNITFSKGSATGFTCTVEKHSNLTFLQSVVASGYGSIPDVEFSIRQYSTLDTSSDASFKFPQGLARFTNMSTLVYNTDPCWCVNSATSKDSSSQFVLKTSLS